MIENKNNSYIGLVTDTTTTTINDTNKTIAVDVNTENISTVNNVRATAAELANHDKATYISLNDQIKGLYSQLYAEMAELEKHILDAGLELPIASTTARGSIKVGDGLKIKKDGTLNVDPALNGSVSKEYVDQQNSTKQNKLVFGDGLYLDEATNTLKVSSTIEGIPCVMPKATSKQLGGVMIGTGLDYDTNGKIYVTTKQAPATSDNYGVVCIGQGLTKDKDDKLIVDGSIYATKIFIELEINKLYELIDAQNDKISKLEQRVQELEKLS